jgi:hypothetical protein
LRRRFRLAWIGLTNSLLLLPVLSYLRSVVLYGSPWRGLPLIIGANWDLIVVATIGFVLEGTKAKSARLVNIGIWLWLAIRSAGTYFHLWGHAENRWIAAYVAPLSCAIAIVDFLLYRSKEELRPSATWET